MNVDLTASQVVELVTRGRGAPTFTMRQLHYWTSESIVRPVDREATRHRRYQPSEVPIARACAITANSGLAVPPLKAISEVVRAIVETESHNHSPRPKKVREARTLLANIEGSGSEAVFMISLSVAGGHTEPWHIDWELDEAHQALRKAAQHLKGSRPWIMLNWSAIVGTRNT